MYCCYEVLLVQVAEYSLTVYYTREFAATTADTLTFIDQVTRCYYPAPSHLPPAAGDRRD